MSKPWIRHDGNYPKGYGDADGKLADKIFNVPTRAEAEKAVAAGNPVPPHTDDAGRRIGLTGVEDAVDWLVGRSDGDWVGDWLR